MPEVGEQQEALDVRARLAPLHLIGTCLVTGVALLAVAVWPLSPIGSLQPDALKMLRFAWAAMALAELPMMFVLRSAMLGRAALLHRAAATARDAAPAFNDAVFAIFRGWSILALAIPEGLALFGCVIMALSGQAIDGLLAGMPVLAMLLVFPTTPRWRAFDERARQVASGPTL